MTTAQNNVRRGAMMTVVTLGVGLLVLGTVFGLGRMLGVELSDMTKDPVSVDLPAHYGIFSGVGVLLWCSSSAMALLAGTSLRGSSGNFLFGFGALGLALSADDMLMLHERILPALIGAPGEYLAYGALGAVALTLAIRHRRELLTAEGFVLAAGMALLGVSVTIDAFWEVRSFIEDTPKLLGIFCWTVALVSRARADLAQALGSASRSGRSRDGTSLSDDIFAAPPEIGRRHASTTSPQRLSGSDHGRGHGRAERYGGEPRAGASVVDRRLRFNTAPAAEVER